MGIHTCNYGFSAIAKRSFAYFLFSWQWKLVAHISRELCQGAKLDLNASKIIPKSFVIHMTIGNVNSTGFHDVTITPFCLALFSNAQIVSLAPIVVIHNFKSKITIPRSK